MLASVSLIHQKGVQNCNACTLYEPASRVAKYTYISEDAAECLTAFTYITFSHFCLKYLYKALNKPVA